MTAAMLKGRDNIMFLHEIDINPRGKRDSIVLPFNMAAVTWSCKDLFVSTFLSIIVFKKLLFMYTNMAASHVSANHPLLTS